MDQGLRHYDQGLAVWEQARMKNVLSLVFLNSGQALIIAVAMTVIMLLAARDVAAGTMTLGSLVMVNAYLIQLFLPLNCLGFVGLREDALHKPGHYGLISIRERVRQLRGHLTINPHTDPAPHATSQAAAEIGTWLCILFYPLRTQAVLS